jgi:hypothetical protein
MTFVQEGKSKAQMGGYMEIEPSIDGKQCDMYDLAGGCLAMIREALE